MKANIIANIIGRFWSIISGFLFIPLYIKFLGFENYSIISFTLIVAGLMAVLDAGLTATLSREIARGDQSIRDKQRVFTTLESCYLLTVLLICVFTFLFSDFIANKWLFINTIDSNSVSFFIKIVGVEAGLQMLFRFYLGGILGFEQQIKANLYQIGWGMLRNGMVVLLIWLLPSLKLFFIWQLISTILFTFLIRSTLLKLLFDKFTFKFTAVIEKEVFQKIWKFAGGMLLISLIAALNTQMDKLFISKLLSISVLGYYTLAISIASSVYVIVSPISVALLPRFTSLYSTGNTKEATNLYKKISLFVAILLFSFVANMIFYANDLIWIWTGDLELAKKAGVFLPILSFSFAMLSLVSIPYDIAISNGYTKLNNFLGILSLFFTVPGYWIATKLYGGIGATYVFCFVQTLITIIYLIFINKKFLKINIYDLLIKRIVLPGAGAIIIAYLLSLIPNNYSDSRVLSLIWIGVLTMITLFTTILLFIPIRQIKDMLKIKGDNLNLLN